MFYDTNQQRVRAKSIPLQRLRAKVYYGGEEIESYTPWCEAGTHIICQFPSGAKIQPYPYTSVESENRHFLDTTFSNIDGVFIPVLGGGPTYSGGSFASMFEKAFESKDDQALLSFIYPFNITALHYFAYKGNKEAITYCFEIGAKFVTDSFGKTPLDYVIMSKDLSAVNAVYLGLNLLSPDDRNAVLQKIPINKLVLELTPDLDNVIIDGGTSVPKTQNFNTVVQIPRNYPL